MDFGSHREIWATLNYAKYTRNSRYHVRIAIFAISCWICKRKRQKAYGTRDSQAVSDPSTNRAQRCLTCQIGRDGVFSTWYGRKRKHVLPHSSHVRVCLTAIRRTLSYIRLSSACTPPHTSIVGLITQV